MTNARTARASTERKAADTRGPFAGGRIVVICPHLEDAVLSIGATIASAVHSGATVEVLTVFGHAPTPPLPPSPHDQRPRSVDAAQVAQERRREDAVACRILGATPLWFDFGSQPDDRGATPQGILAAIKAAVSGATCVLIPGFPLVHADHIELTRLVLSARLPCRVGLYAEQPYLYHERKTLDRTMRAPAIDSIIDGPLNWVRVRAGDAERRLKIRAVRSYRSQRSEQGLSNVGLYWMLWHEASQGGEAFAWLPTTLS